MSPVRECFVLGSIGDVFPLADVAFVRIEVDPHGDAFLVTADISIHVTLVFDLLDRIIGGLVAFEFDDVDLVGEFDGDVDTALRGEQFAVNTHPA